MLSGAASIEACETAYRFSTYIDNDVDRSFHPNKIIYTEIYALTQTNEKYGYEYHYFSLYDFSQVLPHVILT
jgi:hypothetical protein